MRVRVFAIWIIVLTSSMDDYSAFLLDQRCTADAPCFCQTKSIDCEDMHLSTVPRFDQTNLTNVDFTIDLSYNSLTAIPPNAFRNLHPSEMTKMDIILTNNRLITIDTAAFDGVADSVIKLLLDRNEFTSIPKAVEYLSNLKQLDMYLNPVSSFNTSSKTLSIIGKHLESLDVSLSHFTEWPMELNYLKALKELYLFDLRLSDLSPNAFSGFESTLTWLHIDQSDMHKLPEAVCNLHKLESLHFTYNELLTGDILEKCSQNMASVNDVDFSSNHLTTFPNIFGTFSSVKALNLSHNQLKTIDDNQISKNNFLTVLDLDYNLFISIPPALGKLSSLEKLFLEDNKLGSINDSDFSPFPNLNDLSLAYNPINAITNNAFIRNVNLKWISLQGTRLRILPSSLSVLSNLIYLDLDNNPTECSCALSALKAWHVDQSIEIYGYCQSGSTSLIQYLTRNLQSCP